MDSKGNPTNLYANVVQIRVTPNEVVLEFGTFFPDEATPPLVGPKEFLPDARIVMAPHALEQLIDVLSKAATARKAASQQAPSVAKAQ